MAPKAVRSIQILGCRVDDVTMDEAIAICECLVEQRKPAFVVTPNAEIVVAAQRDDALRALINSASLSIPDGAGLLLAGRLLRTPLREQVAGTDLCYRLCQRAASLGWPVFFLGGSEGVAEEAARRLRVLYPNLRIAGTFAGDALPTGDTATCDAVRAALPVDLLFVAYGAPRQENWIARNQTAVGVPLAMVVGGALDFISGRTPRAPRWLRARGLDWLYRLIRQPWRWRRQLALPRFLFLVLRSGWRRSTS